MRLRCIAALSVTVAAVLQSVALAGEALPAPPGLAAPRPPAQPRLAPVPKGSRTESQIKALEKHRPGQQDVGNALETLLFIPALLDGTVPFHDYIATASALTPRHRELLVLRTAWLVGSANVWATHAPIARQAGWSDKDLVAIASGRQGSWTPFEDRLLAFANELFRNSSVSQSTWTALSAQYSTNQMLDAVMTVTEFTSLGLLYNSLGVQPDSSSTDRLPTVPYLVDVPSREPALRTPRVEPVPGDGLAITRTFARYPALARPRSSGSNYVNQGSNLPPRFRELLILRTGWNCQSEYEWAQHVGRVGKAKEMGLPIERIAEGPDAPGWTPTEALLLRAADELYSSSVISDRTWQSLAQVFSPESLVNIVVTASNYRMVSMALNALGVQLDPGDEPFPQKKP